MKKIRTFNLILIVTILFLLGGCIYFYNKSKLPDNRITIGTYTSKDRIDFSEPINSIEDSNYIQFALMNAISVDNPSIKDKIPDKAIWITSKTQGIVFHEIDVWIANNKVVFDMGSKNEHQYKELSGAYGKEFINFISKYKNKQK